MKYNSKFDVLKMPKKRPIFKISGKLSDLTKICESERGSKVSRSPILSGFALKKVPQKSTIFSQNRKKRGIF